MKKVMFVLVLALTFTASMASQVTIDSPESMKQLKTDTLVQLETELSVVDLLGLSENKLSDELMNSVALRPHFIFRTLKQCQSVPECVCLPHYAQWACYIN